MAQIRYRVAWFQYHILLGVTALRGTLPMPPRAPGQPTVASTSISPWYGKLRGWTIQPNPTEKNLSEQVRFCQAKRKRRPVRTPHTRCPEKQAAELLTTARKSRVLRLAHMCSSTIKQQLLDLLQGADPPIPTPPPPGLSSYLNIAQRWLSWCAIFSGQQHNRWNGVILSHIGGHA